MQTNKEEPDQRVNKKKTTGFKIGKLVFVSSLEKDSTKVLKKAD